ncbi:MAG: hypothetical protein RM347_035510 [Nostoc sp. ChiQUE02]|uniref:hypothetical protein n=1 Tax=Nostoc sp. ChiQUE02 TaxID=3075377 RepID=UPI002AD4B0F8|nr:hypothetical protein [Nostoc sp. ChiQUE02]
MVLIIKQRAILEEFHQMLQTLELYIKIAVDGYYHPILLVLSEFKMSSLPREISIG